MKWSKLALCAAVGAGIWLLPHPEQITPEAWGVFALFVATIVGLIAKPLPMGAMALVAMAVAGVTEILPIEELLRAFSNAQIWLIFFACLIARGFIKTGLASRLSYHFLQLFGRGPVGLAYGVIASDLVMAPAIPSSTARAGGVLMPIVRATAESVEREGGRISAFLALVTFHAVVISSAMFVTAMAPNPIVVRLAEEQGIAISWILWAKAALLPGLVSLLLLPWLIKLFAPPTMQGVSLAVAHSREQLAEMGATSRDEWIMGGCFLLLLTLWIFGEWFGLHPTTAALLGVAILLITGVLTWEDVLRESMAWDTLFWFSILVMLAGALNSMGLVQVFSDSVVRIIGAVSWPVATAALAMVYYFSHYFFASITAHVTSMYAAFIAVCIALGAPPLLVALGFGFLSALFGGLTHYSSGQAPVIYAYRYVPLAKWWRVGLFVGLVMLAIWLVVGLPYWRWLGVW